MAVVSSKSTFCLISILVLLKSRFVLSSLVTGNYTNDDCSFTESSPRYFTVDAKIHVLRAREDTLLSDALLRALTSSLGLSECQSSLSVGQTCSASLAEAPCRDPFYLCAGSVAVTQSIFEAAVSGVCRPNTALAATSVVCQSLARLPEVSNHALAGKCQAVCMATPSNNSAPDAMLEAPAPAPSELSSCLTHTLQIRAPTEATALALIDQLRADATMKLLKTAAEDMLEVKSGVDIILVDIGLTEVVGFGEFPPPPPPPPSPPPPLIPFAPQPVPPLPQSPSEANSTTHSLVVGDWGECSATCGKGWQSRSVHCLDANGLILPLQNCPGAVNATFWQPCTKPLCSAYWQYSAWSTCNATCGGGFAFRSASCVASNGGDCGSQPQPTAIKCNTMPCEVYIWSVGSWGECSVECGGGVSTRAAKCLDSSGKEVDAALCSGQKPSTVQKCNLEACDFCKQNYCLGKGSCSDEKCTCNEGYLGAYCQIPPNCNSGFVDANLACCPSGVLDGAGNCCSDGAVVDGDGSCCSTGILDACGVCGGDAVTTDIEGTCCSTVLDAQGLCCESGSLDECGVCDGLSNSCAIGLQLGLKVNSSIVYGNAVDESAMDSFFDSLAEQLQVPSSSVNIDDLQLVVSGHSRRRLHTSRSLLANADDGSLFITAGVTLLPNGTGPTVNVPFNMAWIQAALTEYEARRNNGSINLTSVTSMLRVGMCGNGICEIGERSHSGSMEGVCLADCPIETQACTAGCLHGTCSASSGTCQCFSGYLGEDCSSCAAGYLQSGQVCVVDVVAQQLVSISSTVPPPSPPIPPAPANESSSGVADSQGNTESIPSANEAAGEPSSGTESTDSSNNTGVIIGAVVGSLGAMLVAIAVFVFCRSRRRRHTHVPKGGNERPYGGLTDLESNYVTAEEELGLRQKWSRTNSMASGSLGSAPVLGDISNQMNRMTSSAEFTKYMNGWFHQTEAQNTQRSADGLSSGPLASALTGHGDPFNGGSLDPLKRLVDTDRKSGGPVPQGLRSSYDCNLRQSMSASTTSLPPRPPRKLSSLPASLQSSPHKSRHQFAADEVRTSTQTVLQCSHSGKSAGEESVKRFGGMSDAHAVTSIDAREGISATSADTGVDRSMDHYGKVMLRSYTISPLDPKAKLFYNPAYSNDKGPEMLSDAARSAYKPLSARELRPKGAPAVDPLTARGMQQVSGGDFRSSLDTQGRREKLDRLRAAVSALEADANARRMCQNGPAQQILLESPPQTHQDDSSLQPSVDAYSDITSIGEDSSSPITISTMSAPKFLQGRPAVPKLPLHVLSQPDTDHGDSNGSSKAAGVPKLQLHKLQNVNQVCNDTAPATSAEGELIKAHPGHDPIDNLDSILTTARPQLSSRLADSFKKMVPMMSARRREIDWAAQLSARGIGTPREDSGMMRTRAGEELLSREGSQVPSPDKSEETLAATSTRARPVQPQLPLGTPRTQLLRTLAAEAAVAQKERSLRSMAAPTYADVMAVVDGALTDASSAASPSKIPKPPPVSGVAVRPAGRMSSPSRIPSMLKSHSFPREGSPQKVRLTRLASADENHQSLVAGKRQIAVHESPMRNVSHNPSGR